MTLKHITLPLDGTWQMAHCHVGTGRYNQHPAATMPYTVPGPPQRICMTARKLCMLQSSLRWMQ